MVAVFVFVFVTVSDSSQYYGSAVTVLMVLSATSINAV